MPHTCTCSLYTPVDKQGFKGKKTVHWINGRFQQRHSGGYGSLVVEFYCPTKQCTNNDDFSKAFWGQASLVINSETKT